MKMKTGLCLPGGGAAGMLQAGMLSAADDYREHITVLSTASVGGVNAVMFAQGQTDAMLDLWRNIKKSDVMKRRWWPPPWRRDSLYSTAPLRALVRKHVDMAALRRSNIEVIVHAVECGSGRVRRISQGNWRFPEWLVAGGSLPVIMPPVLINGTYWQDGGIADNTPLAPLIDAGCDRIIVFHCHPDTSQPHRGKPPTIRQQAAGLLGMFMRASQNADAKRLEQINASVDAGSTTNGHRRIHLVNVYPRREIGTLDFDAKKADGAITHGRAVAYEALRGLTW